MIRPGWGPHAHNQTDLMTRRLILMLAARLDKTWLLPIGVMLASPNVWTSSPDLIPGSDTLYVAFRSAQRQSAVPPSPAEEST